MLISAPIEVVIITDNAPVSKNKTVKNKIDKIICPHKTGADIA